MNIVAIILFLLLPRVVIAQDYPALAELDMQKIQQMQSCMEQIDQEKLKFLEQRQSQFNSEVKVLCENGEREQAHKKAIIFSKEMAANPTIQTISKCGAMAKGMMPPMSLTKQDYNSSNQHICDSPLM